MLHVICTVYQRCETLKVLVGSFLLQTNPEWKLHVVHDGPAPDNIKAFMAQFQTNPQVEFTETDKVRGLWGHPNRKIMLSKLQYSCKDFVLITNDDNYYVPKFVEIMLRSANSMMTGMTYCDTLHSYMNYNVLKTRIKVNFVDMGSFIVRVDIAKRVGFKHEHLQADGQYAVECAQQCSKLKLQLKYIPLALFIHN